MSVATRGTVIGVFNSQAEAQAAVNDLRALGFTDSQIGVAYKHDQTASTQGTLDRRTTDTEENASTGAATGAAVGLGAGALWGLVFSLGFARDWPCNCWWNVSCSGC